MGADIHAVIEYKRYETWHCYAELKLLRNYDIFTMLADVRGDGAIIKPRGLPEDSSWQVQGKNYLYVSDKDNFGEMLVTREKADNYVSNYGSHYICNKTLISHPDYHSHSWLTLEELNRIFESTSTIPVEYRCIFSILEQFEKEGVKARFVFWFDN